MADVKTNAVRIVETAGVTHQIHSYDAKEALDAVTVAGKIGFDASRVFKTLVTIGKSLSYYVFVLPGDQELDLKKAAKAVGEKAVEMIHVKDINRITGYVRGGCSPIGMKKAYCTVIDENAILYDTIIVSAGRIGLQLEIAPDDLLALSNASYADILL